MIDQKLIDRVKKEIAELDDYTWWNVNGDGCLECVCNVNNERCILIDQNRPTECPGFDENYSLKEISNNDHLDMLAAMHEIFSGKPFKVGNKTFKLVEVK